MNELAFCLHSHENFTKSISDPNISDKRKIRIYEDIIDAMRNRKKSGNFYIKRPETQHVDCGRILNGDKVRIIF